MVYFTTIRTITLCFINANGQHFRALEVYEFHLHIYPHVNIIILVRMKCEVRASVYLR